MAKPKANERDRRIGIRIRARRNELGLSLASVGKQIGISYQALQKIETGEYRIAASQLELVASILGVKPEYFFADPYGIQSDELMAYAATSEGRAFFRAISRIGNNTVRRNIIRLILTLADEYEQPSASAHSSSEIMAEFDRPNHAETPAEPLRKRPLGFDG